MRNLRRAPGNTRRVVAWATLVVVLLLFSFPLGAVETKRCWLGVCGMQCNATFDDCIDTPNQQSWCSLLIVMGCATEPYSRCCTRPFALF